MSKEILSLLVKVGLDVLSSLIVVLFVTFINKHGDKSKAFAELSKKLPLFIRDAENRNIQGSQNKLVYVLDLACSYLAPRLKKSVQDVREKYASLIGLEVEDILNTPSKKEVTFHEKKNETTQGL